MIIVIFLGVAASGEDTPGEEPWRAFCTSELLLPLYPDPQDVLDCCMDGIKCGEQVPAWIACLDSHGPACSFCCAMAMTVLPFLVVHGHQVLRELDPDFSCPPCIMERTFAGAAALMGCLFWEASLLQPALVNPWGEQLLSPCLCPFPLAPVGMHSRSAQPACFSRALSTGRRRLPGIDRLDDSNRYGALLAARLGKEPPPPLPRCEHRGGRHANVRSTGRPQGLTKCLAEPCERRIRADDWRWNMNCVLGCWSCRPKTYRQIEEV